MLRRRLNMHLFFVFTLSIISLTVAPKHLQAVDETEWQDFISKFVRFHKSSDDEEIAKNWAQLGHMIMRPRTWKSTAGTSLEAKFGGIKDGKIRLRKSDEKGLVVAAGEVTVPMQALSAEDQKFLLDVFAAEFKLLGTVIGAGQQGVDELESKLSMAESKLSMAEGKLSMAEDKVTELSKALQSSAQQIAKLNRQLDMFKPGQGLANDGTPEITTRQIEIQGEQYIGKGAVRMTNATFKSASAGVSSAPGARAGLGTYFPSVAKNWLAIYLFDSQGEILMYAWARTEDFGDFFVSIPKDQKIDLEGFVIRSERDTENQFIITKVTKSAEQK